ncbi:hypothetical protein EIP86_000373 [Pleurotus ostreatoroseus]|nr:hypothetical protein EIP86_000373 [Pleurotus ostreatoroseus]
MECRWTSLTTGNAAVRDGTLSMLTAQGDMSALFFGSQISVYGTFSAVRDDKTSTPVSSVYLIDGVQLGTYTAPNVSAEVDGALFWASGMLDVNKHIIEVQVTSVSPDYAFYFDYMLFIPAPTASAGTSDILATSSSQDTSSSMSASESSTSPALTNKLSLAPPSSSSTSTLSTSASQATAAQADVVNATHHNTGAIAGGVVGGVIGLFTIL